jgi:hypothetical protein
VKGEIWHIHYDFLTFLLFLFLVVCTINQELKLMDMAVVTQSLKFILVFGGFITSFREVCFKTVSGAAESFDEET